MQFANLVLMAVVTLSVAAPTSAQTTGRLFGCFTDAIQNQELPRVTVTLNAQGRKTTTLADDRGCYEFRELPAGLYRVTARLQGFDNVTRDNVHMSPGEVVRVDFTMRISTICECLARPTTLSGFYDRADAVVQARIVQHDDKFPSRSGTFAQRAEALEVFKHYRDGGPASTAFTFLQGQTSGAPDPYSAGQQPLLFLSWSPTENVFSDGYFPQNVTVVSFQSGKVTEAPVELKSYLDSSAEVLLADLRKLKLRR